MVLLRVALRGRLKAGLIRCECLPTVLSPLHADSSRTAGITRGPPRPGMSPDTIPEVKAAPQQCGARSRDTGARAELRKPEGRVTRTRATRPRADRQDTYLQSRSADELRDLDARLLGTGTKLGDPPWRETATEIVTLRLTATWTFCLPRKGPGLGSGCVLTSSARSFAQSLHPSIRDRSHSHAADLNDPTTALPPSGSPTGTVPGPCSRAEHSVVVQIACSISAAVSSWSRGSDCARPTRCGRRTPLLLLGFATVREATHQHRPSVRIVPRSGRCR